MSNYQSLFHVVDLKLELNLHYCTAGAVRVAQRPAAARCAVEHSGEYLCTGSRRGLLYAYTAASKQAGAFRVRSTFCTCFLSISCMLFIICTEFVFLFRSKLLHVILCIFTFTNIDTRWQLQCCDEHQTKHWQTL